MNRSSRLNYLRADAGGAGGVGQIVAAVVPSFTEELVSFVPGQTPPQSAGAGFLLCSSRHEPAPIYVLKRIPWQQTSVRSILNIFRREIMSRLTPRTSNSGH